ncbi:MAG: tRNA (guanosine(37)-N1)-methyltransferase TrmD [Actinomycetia bacterium]|nr:tRNA (guanosine(37)-N1)-methyltransferase TrmD [Actinomycetes bacterium]
MRIDVLTIFPEMFEPLLGASMIGRARSLKVLETQVHDLRDWTHDFHRTVDDAPYGGGPGMVMMVEPLVRAIEAIQALDERRAHTIFFTPAGVPFTQARAGELAADFSRLLLVCGHYEGIDERAYLWADEEISIGDYVLTGGELPAHVLIDAVTRLLPGVLGDETSALDESFMKGLLEYPQYTRPAQFRGMMVPEVLLSGHHANIDAWRAEQALERTRRRRPDLLDEGGRVDTEQPGRRSS